MCLILAIMIVSISVGCGVPGDFVESQTAAVDPFSKGDSGAAGPHNGYDRNASDELQDVIVPPFMPSCNTTIKEQEADWWSRVQRGLVEAEYHASENEHGLQAPNRAHNLRTFFDPTGIRVQTRTEVEHPQPFSLSLAGIGRDAKLSPIAEGIVNHAAGRVEIHRPGVIEWYENSARGLEQGFTLEACPLGEGPLVLELAVERARAALHDQSVVLATEAGRKLRYGALTALDATGRTLPSHLEVPGSQRVRLVINDSSAVYPLLIDPLLTSVADAFLESNQPDPPGFLPAAFGGSVSSAGDVNGDGFDDVIVGAPGWDGGDPQEGAAFVFLGSANGVVGTDPTTAHAWIESNQAFAQLGTVPQSRVGDVNGDGFDDIIVGAHFYDDSYVDPVFGLLGVTGAAFVFNGSASGITGTDPTTSDAWIRANQFSSDLGTFVSGAGDVNGDGFADVLVGVPGHGTPFPPSIPPNQRSGSFGAALVFHGGPAGIVGTGFDDADSVLLSYEDTGLPQPTIYGTIGMVAGAGDVNGDGFDDIVCGGSEISLFLGSVGGIVGTDLLAAQRIAPAGPFGFTVPGFSVVAAAGDINGDGFADILASTPFRELEIFHSTAEGVAYAFLGGPSGLGATNTTEAHATFWGDIGAAWVGLSLAGAGDVDGDGYDDVLIGAREYPGSLNSEGVVYLFRGGPLGIVTDSLLDADLRLESKQSGAMVLGNNIAFDVSGAGDVNGDGLADVIVGKGYWDAGQENEGAAFVFQGEPWPTSPNQPPVAIAGADQVYVDLDNDGLVPITVDGSASFDPDGSIVSYVWLKGETVLGTSPILTTDLPITGDQTLVLTVTDDVGLTRGDPVTVRVEPLDNPRIFFESFGGGLGAWTTLGDVSMSNAACFSFSSQARLGASGAVMSRSSAILPPTAIGVSLAFWGKAGQFSASDELLIKVSADGGPFTTIYTVTAAESDDTCSFYGGTAIPLTHTWFPATASNVVIQFESNMSTGNFFIDDVDLKALYMPNLAPTANAGPDQAVIDVGGDGVETVTLDGTASTDSDGAIVLYNWRVDSTWVGTGATLDYSFDVGVHVVNLTVTDDGSAAVPNQSGAQDQDTVTITVGPDCQSDGIPDALQLAGNDANANGIPDECDPPGDMNGNGTVEPADIPLFANVLLGIHPQGVSLADMNNDGLANGLDTPPFLDCILTGVCP